MASYRRNRINDETKKTVSAVLGEIKDPRVSSAFISITGADVTGDMKYAKIYYSVLGADADGKKEVARGLKSSAGYIRRRLAAELDLRQTPELTFVCDTSIEYGAHISSVLNGLTYSDEEEKGDEEDGE